MHSMPPRCFLSRKGLRSCLSSRGTPKSEVEIAFHRMHKSSVMWTMLIATRRLPSAHMFSRTMLEVLANQTSHDLFAGRRGQTRLIGGFPEWHCPCRGEPRDNLSPLYWPVCSEVQNLCALRFSVERSPDTKTTGSSRSSSSTTAMPTRASGSMTRCTDTGHDKSQRESL